MDFPKEKEIILPFQKYLPTVIPLVIHMIQMMRFELHNIGYLWLFTMPCYSGSDLESGPELTKFADLYSGRDLESHPE